MPQIRENEHVVPRPRLNLNETWSDVSQARCVPSSSSLILYLYNCTYMDLKESPNIPIKTRLHVK